MIIGDISQQLLGARPCAEGSVRMLETNIQGSPMETPKFRRRIAKSKKGEQLSSSLMVSHCRAGPQTLGSGSRALL
jgi:hypothetical protein